MRLLAAALKTNTRVTKLDLTANEAVTDAGGRALLDMLRANTTVRKIELWGCKGMSKFMREEVKRAMRLVAARAHVIAEGAGASSVAGALSGKAGGGKIACVVSGGNIDLSKLAKILQGQVP